MARMNARTPVIKLNDGRSIPVIGLGTYIRGGGHHEECRRVVQAALEIGYRYIDTATLYKNEEAIGDAIRTKIADGTITREDIFITTKLWNNRHRESEVVPALEESLKKLGLEYVDLYLIHWPMAFNDDGSHDDIDYVETWKGMEECRRLGLTKSIGVSNFNEKQLQRILDNCQIPPALNQFEVNLNMTQKSLIRYCQEKGIVCSAYSPLGSMPASKASDSAPAPRLDDPVLSEIGRKYGKSTTQIALRYLIDRNLVITPKSYTPKRIQENFNIFDFKLTAEEIIKLDNFNCDFRVIPVALWRNHSQYPF